MECLFALILLCKIFIFFKKSGLSVILFFELLDGSQSSTENFKCQIFFPIELKPNCFNLETVVQVVKLYTVVN